MRNALKKNKDYRGKRHAGSGPAGIRKNDTMTQRALSLSVKLHKKETV
jgi:hypothetical protein